MSSSDAASLGRSSSPGGVGSSGKIPLLKTLSVGMGMADGVAAPPAWAGVVDQLATPPKLVPAPADEGPMNTLVRPLLTDLYQVSKVFGTDCSERDASVWQTFGMNSPGRISCSCFVFPQITMAYAYWNAGRHMEHSVFDAFFRKNPFSGEFTLFAGLEEVLRFVQTFRFLPDEIEYLRWVRGFPEVVYSHSVLFCVVGSRAFP
jgi:Nicotinate phosphoribosyltransferase (NAPRTase) N-terminal domain